MLSSILTKKREFDQILEETNNKSSSSSAAGPNSVHPPFFLTSSSNNTTTNNNSTTTTNSSSNTNNNNKKVKLNTTAYGPSWPPSTSTTISSSTSMMVASRRFSEEQQQQQEGEADSWMFVSPVIHHHHHHHQKTTDEQAPPDVAVSPTSLSSLVVEEEQPAVVPPVNLDEQVLTTTSTTSIQQQQQQQQQQKDHEEDNDEKPAPATTKRSFFLLPSPGCLASNDWRRASRPSYYPDPFAVLTADTKPQKQDEEQSQSTPLGAVDAASAAAAKQIENAQTEPPHPGTIEEESQEEEEEEENERGANKGSRLFFQRVLGEHHRTTCSSCCDNNSNNSARPQTLATVYCYECARSLCDVCDEHLHDDTPPSLLLDPLDRPLDSHRVEYIAPTNTTLAVLSPLFDLVILAAAAQWILRPCFLWMTTTIMASPLGGTTDATVDYFLESICPMVQHGRRFVFRIDPDLYTSILRQPLETACHSEDSVWKLFTDLWVRGIVTHTDSLSLIWNQALPTAIVVLIVGRVIVIPLLAFGYAILASLVRWIEVTIVAPIIHNIFLMQWTAQFLGMVYGMVTTPLCIPRWICQSTIVGWLLFDDQTSAPGRGALVPPPHTAGRKRPWPPSPCQQEEGMMLRDVQFLGVVSRISRVYTYYYSHQAYRVLWETLVTIIFFTLSFRMGFLLLLSSSSSPTGASGASALLSQIIHKMTTICCPTGTSTGTTSDGDPTSPSSWMPIMMMMSSSMACELARQLEIYIIPSSSSSMDDGVDHGDVGNRSSYYFWTKLQQHHQKQDKNDDKLLQRLLEAFQQWPWQARTALLLFGVVVIFFPGLLNHLWRRWDQRRRRRQYIHRRRYYREEEVQEQE